MWTEPITDEDWRDTVDLAKACLILEDAQARGLILGGPQINVARCDELLAAGKERGFEPRPDVLTRLVDAYQLEAAPVAMRKAAARAHAAGGDEGEWRTV